MVKTNEIGCLGRDSAALGEIADPRFREIVSKLLEVAFNIGVKRLGSDHPEIVPIMANLAQAMKRAGALPEAKHVLERALDVTERRLGPRQSWASTIAWNLFILLVEMGMVTDGMLLAEEHLAWLLECSTENLSADQWTIRAELSALRRRIDSDSARMN